MKLETKRLFLREMTFEDYTVLYTVLADSDIMQHYPYTFDKTRVLNWIGKNIERYRVFGFGLWAGVSERELAEKSEIKTDFGETLSWKYLCYVREHPISWRIPTCILYGGHDNMTSLATITAFAEKTGAELIVMPDGEHWFHTEEQMRFLDSWLRQNNRGGTTIPKAANLSAFIVSSLETRRYSCVSRLQKQKNSLAYDKRR